MRQELRGQSQQIIRTSSTGKPLSNTKLSWAGLALIAALATGCTSETVQDPKVTVPKVTVPPEQTAMTTDKQTYSYEQYQKLYQKFATDFTLPEYTKEFDHLTSPEVVIVDPEVSFGKRTVLTVSGKTSDTSPKTTQNQVIFQNHNTGVFLNVDFIFLNQSLGKDMVNWDFMPPQKLQNVPELKKFHSSTLAYHNILVRLSLISTKDEPVGPQMLNNMTKSVVKYLEDAEL